jgi:hypothetical protein
MLYILSVMAWLATAATLGRCLLDRPWRDLADDEVAAHSVVERFNRTSGGSQDVRESIPPLVQQAVIYAKYLNPPSPPEQDRPSVSRPNASVADIAPRSTPAGASPKFELHGISYHRTRPSESMALVWDAVEGHRWVRQGSQLGHVVIEEIHADAISYTSGSGIQRMALDPGRATTVTATAATGDSGAPASDEPRSVVQRWVPVRGLRQMPVERVAAKLGFTLQDGGTEMH